MATFEPAELVAPEDMSTSVSTIIYDGGVLETLVRTIGFQRLGVPGEGTEYVSRLAREFDNEANRILSSSSLRGASEVFNKWIYLPVGGIITGHCQGTDSFLPTVGMWGYQRTP